jgi:hypothetical protein
MLLLLLRCFLQDSKHMFWHCSYCSLQTDKPPSMTENGNANVDL